MRKNGLRPGIALRAGALAAALVVGPKTALATPAELFGTGPRSTALAGAGTSLELDAESALMNPAKLAPAAKQLSFGLRTSRLVLELEQAGAQRRFPAESAKGFYLGVTAPLSDGDVESAFGLFAGSPHDFIVRADLPFAEEPDFPLLVRRSSAFDFAAGLGVKVDSLSFGLGLRVLAALTGNVGVQERDGVPSQVIDNELVPALAPVFGFGFEPGGGFSLGASLRTALRADFDVTLATSGLGGIPLPPMHVRGVAHYEPLRVDAEVSRRFERTTLLVALGYERWSDYPGTLGSTLECPSDVPTCGSSAPEPPNASDIVVPRLAGEHEFGASTLKAAVRAGYSFVPAALPEQRGPANAFDSARHGFSLGYSLGLPPDAVPLHLDAAFRFDLLVPRTHDKTNGESVRTSGSVQSFVFGARLDL
jgi:long-chain fatty acid transport protein